MREGATLKLDSGEELRVHLEREELDRDEIVVRRAPESARPLADRLAVLDEIIETAAPHPAGATDAWIARDHGH